MSDKKSLFTKLYITKGILEYHKATKQVLPWRWTLFTSDKSRNEECIIKKKGR